MALSSEAIDLAVICSSKAVEFVKQDDRFVLIPNIISNSSVVVIKKQKAEFIGVSMGKGYEKDMVVQMVGDNCNIVEFSAKALPYALAKGEIDGIVIDYLNAVNIEGEMIFPKDNQVFDTFSLIVRKDFIESKEYAKFVKAYNKAVNKLREGYNLLESAEKQYGQKFVDERRKQEWKKLNIRIRTLEK